jgi:hypothetical protein
MLGSVSHLNPSPAMKARIVPVVISLVVVAAVTQSLVAADATPPPAAKPTVNAAFVNPTSPEAATVCRIGESAMNWLGSIMFRELSRAVTKDGLEGAVDVCHLKNVPMTDGRISVFPQITAVKRTSLRLLSTANAPDPADQLALDEVRKDLSSGADVPKVLVQRIDHSNAAPEWRVYRPLGVQSECVGCHGDSGQQSPALREKLNRLYPTDKPASFTVGEWRGLMRVTVDPTPPPPPPPPPPKTAPNKK